MAAVLRVLYGFWSMTWRVIHRDEPEVAAPVIYAHWHGDELALIGPFSRRDMAVMVSKSRDGEMQRRLLGWLGYFVVRGSSSRGAVEGLKGLVDEVLAGRTACIAIDGPRGPRGVVKGGVLKLAQLTGRPIVPGAVSCRGAWHFPKTWNQCFLPYPMSTVIVQYGQPIWVPSELTEESFEQRRLELQATLHGLKVLAEGAVATQFSAHLPLPESTR